MNKKNLSKKYLPLGLILSSTALGLSSSTHLYAQNSDKEDKDLPNVIYFLCDDLGYSDIEVYGNEIISTPRLKELASQGMVFTQHYSGSSVSAPSRASLITGLHTGHTKIRGNKEIQPEGQESFNTNMKTLAALFKSAGYTTAAFGKWGLGYPGSGAEPTDVGFDSFYGYNCQRQSHSYYPKWLYRDKNKEMLDGKQYSSDLIHKEALKFIKNNKDKRFFGYFAYTLPHASLEQPKDSIYKMYENRFDEKRYPGYGDYSPAERPRAEFAAMVTRIDTYVGDIIDELKKQGILDNTLFIFTSDNGPHTEGGADPDFFNTKKLLRGYKRSLYEGGVRVPFIAMWKGHIVASSMSDHISAFWDMMPTFTELTKQEKTWNQKTDGISFLPTLLGKKGQKEHDHLYFEFHEEKGRQMVRKGDWVLIRQNINSEHPSLELYNLNPDLHEDNDLSRDYPEKVEELRQIMDNSRTESPIFNFGKKK